MKNPVFWSFVLLLLFSCEENRRIKTVEKPKGWIILDTQVDASLRGLSPITENIVWASGSNGTWLRTLDGGINWDSGVINGLDSVDFRDIEGIDASTAIAMSSGQPALIFKTLDGGKTWEKKFEGSDKDFFDGMYFQRKKGIVLGDPVDNYWKILTTDDLGETWKVSERSPKAKEGAGSFAASGSTVMRDNNRIWFASGGLSSDIFFSDDDGMHWKIISTPILQGEPSQGIFSFTKVSDQVLIAVGGDYLKSDFAEKNAIISTDGGMSWELIEGNLPKGYRSGISYFPLHHWLISVGPSGSDYSRDGGINWEKFSEEGFHAIFRDKAQSSIWASGSKGRIAKLDY
ncbi:WD40/YVTN/BNR-like repeat-containing protein [Mongoliibacter ruber]|uniref:Photosystem II stability/assembly factor-like uncharacterized protein n=1 Tax=Mongoliibacter ruber TaxID=1750599 RepID=A0A2T0WSE0_9BACT|nr:YCF48-related protein [Mongoliibacter ruber]PRY89616.1 photosystem II stability/assembly factor-like uncharacterized protein [Mongoliibacter ruber]